MSGGRFYAEHHGRSDEPNFQAQISNNEFSFHILRVHGSSLSALNSNEGAHADTISLSNLTVNNNYFTEIQKSHPHITALLSYLCGSRPSFTLYSIVLQIKHPLEQPHQIRFKYTAPESWGEQSTTKL